MRLAAALVGRQRATAEKAKDSREEMERLAAGERSKHSLPILHNPIQLYKSLNCCDARCHLCRCPSCPSFVNTMLLFKSRR